MKTLLFLLLLSPGLLTAKIIDLGTEDYSWIKGVRLIQLSDSWAVFTSGASTDTLEGRLYFCVKRSTVIVKRKGQYMGEFQLVRRLKILETKPGQTTDGFPITLIYCEALPESED